MALNIYPNIMASGSVPPGWQPVARAPLKYPVKNPAVLHTLRALAAGHWQKVIKLGQDGSEVHYFEHQSGQVADVKYFPP